MPVINGVYLKDFTALPGAVADADIIPIAITGDQIAYRTTVAGIVTDARITAKLLTGLSVTGGAVIAADTILEAFGKVQNQINGKQGTITLTTTGTSGAATFVSNTLNIPNYADGGVLSLSAIGGTANANAATITGTVLNLQPADASFGGVVTTGTQTFAGDKTFTDVIKPNASTGLVIFSNLVTTNLIYQAFQNTGGQMKFGISSSAGSAIFSNESAYATVFGSGNATSLQFATNNIVRATFASGGDLLLTGTVSSTPQGTLYGTASASITSSQLATSLTDETGTGSVVFSASPTFTGVPIFGSSISNGTYTYTLPSATGTLALTSDLTGYLPLTGGTLTGALGGTSATFSGLLTSTLGNNTVLYNAVSATTGYQYANIQSGNARLIFGIEAATSAGIFTDTLGNSAAIGSASATGAFHIASNSIVRQTVFSGGNIGIGTTTDAGYKLDVSGTGRFTSNLTLGSGATLYMTAGDIQFVSNAGYGILTADSNRLISIQNGAFGVNGAATFSSTITTAAPSGGTAKPFKIGNVATVTPTSQNRTIEIEIDGTTYYLTAKTTNN
jgi:hypothetical protein